MTLYEYLKMSECDYDTFDVAYDAEVTVCHVEEENDEYDKFCNGIMKKVNVIKVNDSNLIVDWSELITNNIDKFKEFTSKHWYESCQYENDKDEFIYQWIKEIHYYMAGYVSEDFYLTLNELVDSLD